jgi:putative peptidoglycan lipid II flippase
MMREGGKLSLLTLISRILGLAREMTRAAFMGTGALGDSFTMAFMIPNLLRRLFAEGSVSVAFIPTYKSYLIEGDEEKEREFLSASFTVLLVLVLAAVALGIALSPWIVLLFKSDPVETSVLTRLMFPFLALVSVAAYFQGILNSKGLFSPSGLAPILFNLCFIAVPYLAAPFTKNPARAMALGVVVGGLAQALCQLPAVLRTGARFGLQPLGRAFRNPGMRRVLLLVAPTILGMAAYQLNELVCTAVASRAGTGVATSLSFSLRLLELILGIFAVSIGTVLLPELAAFAKRGEWKRFSQQLGKAVDAIALITVPAAAFSMALGREIVIVVYKARAFGEESVALTTRAFFFHMLGLFFIAANRILAPAFYARGDTKSPTWAGMVSFALNICLAFALVGPMAGGGIALALSIASAANSFLLVYVILKARIEGMAEVLKASTAYFGKICLFSLIAIVPVLLLKAPLLSLFAESSNRFLAAGLPLLAETLVFGGVGLALLAMTKDPISRDLLASLGRQGRMKEP